jgi:hypothetical protein
MINIYILEDNDILKPNYYIRKLFKYSDLAQCSGDYSDNKTELKWIPITEELGEFWLDGTKTFKQLNRERFPYEVAYIKDEDVEKLINKKFTYMSHIKVEVK